MNRLSPVFFALIISCMSLDAAARASDLEVRTLDGESVALSSYFEPGKWTMVMLWTTYCGTCRAQYPTISAFHDKHKASDAKVLGISLDGISEAEKVREYMAGKPMSFDSAIVDIEAFQTAYKSITEESFTGTPTYLMFDPKGFLVAHVPGTLAMEAVEQFIAENNGK